MGHRLKDNNFNRQLISGEGAGEEAEGAGGGEKECVFDGPEDARQPPYGSRPGLIAR